MRNFQDLKVWQKSHQLVLEIYKVTENFPIDERFGLISQIRRSGASIPTNIAEGCGRETDLDRARFISIAAGSASETEYHILLAHDLGFLDKNTYNKLKQHVNEVKRMLNSFIQKLKANC